MCYHGTTKDNADIIIRDRYMLPSTGDDQWLGEGYYFYYDIEYAFRWILIKYTNNFKNQYADNYDKIYNEYSILSAKIDIDQERVFDLDKIEHRLLFINTKMAISEKTARSQKYNNRLKNNSVVDGVIFNYLFKYEDYKEKYDAVKVTFPISYIFDNSRMDYLPEPQLCVKNIEVISNYKLASTKEVPEQYKNFIVDYNKVKKKLSEKNKNKYKKTQRNVKYKRREIHHDGNREN